MTANITNVIRRHRERRRERRNPWRFDIDPRVRAELQAIADARSGDAA